MASTASWGLTIPLIGVPLLAHRDIVRALPGFGYTDVWSSEVSGADAFTPLALASVWEPTMRLGTAIVPVYTRGPALIAMSAATLAAAAPGRFVLGLGASSPVIVDDWNGLDFDEPYRRTPRRPALRQVGPGRRAGRRRLRHVHGQAVQAGEPSGRPAAGAARSAAAADAAAGRARGRRRDPELAGLPPTSPAASRRSAIRRRTWSRGSSSARPRTSGTRATSAGCSSRPT